MRKTGTVQVTDELELKDFNWTIDNIRIDITNKEVTVEVLMWENHHKHSRVFRFTPNPGTAVHTKLVDLFDIAKAKLLTMPMFEGSTE